MSEANDPEERLAEALRAQAAQAPPKDAPVPAEKSPAGTRPFESGEQQLGRLTDSNFELLSGNEYAGNHPLGHGERAPAAASGQHAATTGPPGTGASAAAHRRPLPAVWVLVLALLLGLAAGAVAGVLTFVP